MTTVLDSFIEAFKLGWEKNPNNPGNLKINIDDVAEDVGDDWIDAMLDKRPTYTFPDVSVRHKAYKLGKEYKPL